MSNSEAVLSRNDVAQAAKENNRVRAEDTSVHGWYRFVLSYPPHLVRDYIGRFRIAANGLVLDPFCGTGTTLVECKKVGVRSCGLEANPLLCFASRVKVDWSVDPHGLFQHALGVAETANERLRSEGLEEGHHLPLFKGKSTQGTPKLCALTPEANSLLLANSISPLPLHRVLVLLEALKEVEDERFVSHERLALARTIVGRASNLEFGPEVGVGPAKEDAPVVSLWLDAVRAMAEDLRTARGHAPVESVVHQTDARRPMEALAPASVDAVITSPPYPNEKDYTRTTRLESVLLGFVHTKKDLRALKQTLIRSNTRAVYKDDRDDSIIAGHKEIQRIADEIEQRRIALGKTSGFERLYAKATKLYFGGMARHLSELRSALRPGAQLAYVVGDQASYLRVMIRTGQLLADLATSLGYEVLGLDLFRTRLSTATKEQLREEVLHLQWPGESGRKGAAACQ